MKLLDVHLVSDEENEIYLSVNHPADKEKLGEFE